MIGNFPMIAATLSHEIKTKVKGEITTGFSAPVAISVIEPQPVTENDLKLLEQGERIGNWRVTWTATEIKATDRISVGGRVYRVHQVNDRSEFYRAVMREVLPNVA